MLTIEQKELIKKYLNEKKFTQKQIAEMVNVKEYQVSYIIRKQYMDDYYNNHKEEILKVRKDYNKNNKEKISKRKKEYRLKNAEKEKERARNYRSTHHEQRNKYERERKEKDPNYRFLTTLRKRIALAVKSQMAKKIDRTLNLIGCSYEDLRKHLEEQFRDGMTWENYGKIWQVDHIIPCAAFDLTDEEQQKKCFHYSNLQPLLVEENQIKNDILPDGTRGRFLRKNKEGDLVCMK